MPPTGRPSGITSFRAVGLPTSITLPPGVGPGQQRRGAGPSVTFAFDTVLQVRRSYYNGKYGVEQGDQDGGDASPGVVNNESGIGISPTACGTAIRGRRAAESVCDSDRHHELVDGATRCGRRQQYDQKYATTTLLTRRLAAPTTGVTFIFDVWPSPVVGSPTNNAFLNSLGL